MSEGTCFSPSWLPPAPEVRHTSCRSGLQAQQWHSHSWLCAFSAQVEAPDLQFILSLEGSGERRFSSAADHAIANTNGFSHRSALLPLPRHLRFVHPAPRFGPSAGVRQDSRCRGCSCGIDSEETSAPSSVPRTMKSLFGFVCELPILPLLPSPYPQSHRFAS